jgi:hypothetical protein
MEFNSFRQNKSRFKEDTDGSAKFMATNSEDNTGISAKKRHPSIES